MHMATPRPAVPEWLKSSRSSSHIISVIRTLLQREQARASARSTSRQRSIPSKTRRLSRGLSFTDKSDHVDHYSITAGCNPDNEACNRYMDIIPYDRTRVVISDRGVEKGENAPNGGRYLNANWVRERAGGKWWIATQAPLPNTAHAFLSALREPLAHPPASRVVGSSPSLSPASMTSRVRTVVQLTQNIESGMRKAHVYFPPLEGQSWIVQPEEGCLTPPLKVTLVRFQEIDYAQCIQCTVSIEPLSANQPEPVVFQHLLYGSWPDHGVPSAEDRASFLNFVRLVDEANRDLSSQPQGVDLDPDPPIMVNCSAGVGRTGAFIAVSSLLRAYGFLSPAATPPEQDPLTPSPLGPLPKELSDDLIAQEIDALREQRPGMVQKEEQVTFIYDMLLAAFDVVA
ncbi:hypothetical protein POSPLADRAFT_1042426 [Postia placenta MAD-698-R-SB12]|uniref:Tyrosine specific protein phosphatases domain-containing protein n=1 Tax=Postia placenta MAD-698-R-SB12 TaxID=670580 RepID=A0A1X6NFG8_9APHY|nr:hypothetical protein POSPLADRAFT_1042426 [Postia placenta MAD-698-R-SB12]OSX67166.1 hypothetical protein POSPLADRAFT_1042426 [Postia placenta MAD-698-R-SB12]